MDEHQNYRIYCWNEAIVHWISKDEIQTCRKVKHTKRQIRIFPPWFELYKEYQREN